jgi:hypothetical protein
VDGVKLTANLGQEIMSSVFIPTDPDENLSIFNVRLDQRRAAAIF